MKLSEQNKKTIIMLSIIALLLLVAQNADNAGRQGAESCDIEFLRDICEPGLSIWEKTVVNTSCASGIKYSIDELQPPTYTFKEECPDGNVCCRVENNSYATMLMSNCTNPMYDVEDSFCEPHECDLDSDCGSILADAPNDCSPFWVAHKESVNGTCTEDFKCVYSSKEATSCKDWQIFIQDYKIYIGIALLLVIIGFMMMSRNTGGRRR